MPVISVSLPNADYDKGRELANKKQRTIGGIINEVFRDYLDSLDENMEVKGNPRELELEAEIQSLRSMVDGQKAKEAQLLSIYTKRQNLLLERIEQLDPNFDRHQFIREVRM